MVQQDAQKGNAIMSEDILKDSWAPEGPISKTIKDRIKKAGKRFHSNDNISEFIKEGEMEKLQTEVQEKLQGVLDSLVIDTENDHNTHRRLQSVWQRCMCEKHSEEGSSQHRGSQVSLTWVTKACTPVVRYR